MLHARLNIYVTPHPCPALQLHSLRKRLIKSLGRLAKAGTHMKDEMLHDLVTVPTYNLGAFDDVRMCDV